MTATTWPRRLRLTDSYGISGFGMLLSILGVLVVVLTIVFASVVYGGRAYGRTTCVNFATETGFQTKFVVLNWADAGTCLALAPNGRWIKNTQIVQFIQASKS